MAFEGSYVAATDAGLCGLWQREHFEHVTTLDAWEDEVSEDESLEDHLLDWEAEPGAVGEDGSPTSTALPDFLVEVHPEPDEPTPFRSSARTFDQPE